MANILVRDIPADVHATLQRRAAREGKSLQQYLAAELTRIADRPSVVDVLDRIERRPSGAITLDAAVDAVRRGRER